MNRIFQTIINRKYLLSSIVFIAILLIASFSIDDKSVKSLPVEYHNNGKIVEKAPYPPSEEYLLGSDRKGRDLSLLLIIGAKYTIISSLVIAFLRLIIGGTLGILIRMYAAYSLKYIHAFFLPIKSIPSIIIALIFIGPIVNNYQNVDINKTMVIQVSILVLLAIPSLISWGADLSDKLNKTSFIQSSYLLGASKWQIIRKHMWPQIKGHLGLMFLQQYIQTLTIMMYLGFFGYFIGGTVEVGIKGIEEQEINSITNEWAGIIGQNIKELILAPWLILTPILCFFILILLTSLTQKEWESNTINSTLPIKTLKDEKITKLFTHKKQFEFLK